MIRRAEASQVTLFIVSSGEQELSFVSPKLQPYTQSSQILALGTHCYCHIYYIKSDDQHLFPTDELIEYELHQGTTKLELSDYTLEGQHDCAFIIPQILNSVLHGSCRNPHHYAQDALVTAADDLAQQRQHNTIETPSILIMSGDQIYADDVAGPMLQAIEKLIKILGLYTEPSLINALEGRVDNSLYCRDKLLPKTTWQQRSKLDMGYWLRKDLEHFTSLKSHNHLVSLEEFFALYILNTSAVCWQLVDINCLEFISDNPVLSQRYQSEKSHLQSFVKGLPKVEALLANISHLTMFDDHDVTDDWNLTAGWEQAIYSSPVSKRMIANGLISYLVFQGVGNDGGRYSANLIDQLAQHANECYHNINQFDDHILSFGKWHYTLATQPKIIAMDTRTHRWRNETNFNEPSGLMDWEQLIELESEMTGLEQVILVSPAPVFGVKSIEAIQAIFNFFGQALLVDVENWMAHEGAARKLMQIFKRSDTPVETLILSGDVHYSFCFSVQSRFSERDNRIWQLTASGIKNEFPRSLLNKLDIIDTVLYHRNSPLNLFTKRWQVKVRKHKHMPSNKYLVSGSAISVIFLENEKLVGYKLLHGDGSTSEFDLIKHD
jgi:hypothetical protein